jgi:acyl-CoA synthetase (AMP-forming)/AMP-acid ligase II
MAVVVPSGRGPSGKVRYEHLTFRQLDHDSDSIARGLVQAGIAPGTRAIVMVRPGLDFFSLIFAVFKAGIVPVLIDPGIGLQKLGHCCEQSAPGAFIGIPKAYWATKILGWGKKTIRHKVVVRAGGKTKRAAKRDGQPEHARTWSLGEIRRIGAQAVGTLEGEREQSARHDETAAILFTSGSTGPPKGVVYTHAIFQAQVERLRSLYAIEPGEIDLCTFPLFALFGPALGMTAVVPDMDPTRPARACPQKLFEAIEDFGVTNLFGSPALLRRLAEAGERTGMRLPTLRRVTSSGAPVSARVLGGVARMLAPGAQVFTPYGATESLPVASIGSDEVLGETRARTDLGYGVCVGRPVDGLTALVIRIDDGPIARWSDDLLVADQTIGEIVVSGPMVTRDYFGRPDATALAKIDDPERGRFFHRMGDVGYRDDQGRLWFCGRKAHRVILEHETLFTIPCEAIFNTHPRVARSALVGVKRGGKIVPVICIEPVGRLTRAEEPVLREELLAIGQNSERTRMIGTILFHPSFPVDIRHNAKIFREKLALWAAGRVS